MASVQRVTKYVMLTSLSVTGQINETETKKLKTNKTYALGHRLAHYPTAGVGN